MQLVSSGPPPRGRDDLPRGLAPFFDLGRLVIFLVGLTLPLVAQTTWFVDASVPASGDGLSAATAFKTIQEGITSAVAGDTVMVAAGDYVLTTALLLDRSIQIVGAQAGVDARGRVAGSPSPLVESVISGTGVLLTLSGGAGGAVLDGFALTGGTRAVDSASGAPGDLDGLVIRNCHFSNSTGAFVFLDKDAADLSLSRNVFTSSSTAPFLHFAAGLFLGLEVVDNELVRTGAPSGAGLLADGDHNIGPSGLRAPHLDRNLVQGHGVGMDLGSRSFTGGVIEGNQFVGNGIGLGFGIQSTLIRGNEFLNNTDRGLALGDGNLSDPSRGAVSLTVRENVFSGSGQADAALASGQAPGQVGTLVFRENLFQSAVGFRNDDASGDVVDLSANAWNDVTGPMSTTHVSGLGAQITGAGASAVDFSPWFDSSVDADALTAGFQGDRAAFTVDDDSPQAGSEGRVEEALSEVASGGAVSVSPGTYAESRMTLNQPVTVAGPTGGGATLLAVEDTADTPSSDRAWLLVTAPSVVLKDLDFDGDSVNGRVVHQALRITGPNALVQNCNFTRIKNATYAGIAIVSFDNTVVDGCTFVDIERVGVLFFGTGVTAGQVVNCTYTGKGLGDHEDHGIELGGGAVVSVSGTTVTACSGTNLSNGFESAAILVSTFFGAGTTLSMTGGNQIHANMIGVQIGFGQGDASHAVISGDDLSGNSRFNLSCSGDATEVIVESTNLTGAGEAGLSVRFGALVDAGNCGVEVTSLGLSAAGNDFSGYGFDDLQPFAVIQENPAGMPVVYAHGNDFGLTVATDDIETLLQDDDEDATVAAVEFTNSTPLIFCPPGLTVSCPGDVPQPVQTLAAFRALGGVISTSNPVTLTSSDVTTGSPSNLPGVHFVERTYSFMDACGGAASCSAPQVIDIVDTVAPVAVCNNFAVAATLDPITGVYALTPADLAAIGAGSTDDCSAFSNLQIMATPSTLTCADIPQATISIVVMDEAGNLSTNVAMCTVTVGDTASPVLTACPGNVTASTDSGLCTATVSWTPPVATDNCSVTLTSTHNPGDSFGLGTTTVVYTATDPTGNMASCSFDVVVTDNEGPTISCPADVMASTDTGLCTASGVTLGTATGSDPCGAVTITNDAPSLFPAGVTVVTWTASDAAGNDSTCMQTVTVTDGELPTITCPGNIAVGTDPGACTAQVTFAVTGSDNCSMGLAINQTDTTGLSSGDAFPIGTTTLVFQAVDVGGNAVSCSFDVVVADGEPPVLTPCPGNINVTPSQGGSTAAATWTPPVASDNCPGVNLTSTHNPGDSFPIGTTLVTYTATDAAGNTTSCSFSVVVAADFAAAVDYSLLGVMSTPGVQASDVVLADMGSSPTNTLPDGHLDIVAALSASDEVAILFNDGMGAFPVLDLIDVSGAGSNPGSLAFGNLDGMPGTDLALTLNGSDSVLVLLNTGNGLVMGSVFDLFAGLGAHEPVDIAVADVDLAGTDDIVVACLGDLFGVGETVALSVNGGAFAPLFSSLGFNRPGAVAFCARDADPFIDLVIAQQAPGVSSQNVLLYENDLAGGFFEAPVHLDVPEQAFDLCCGDLNGDGIPNDIGVLTRPALPINPGIVSVFVNNGGLGFNGNSFNAPILAAAGLGVRAIACGDLQADTLAPGLVCAQDVIVADGGQNRLSLFLGLDCFTGVFDSTDTLTTSSAPSAVAIGDVDGNGIPDLVIANQGGDSVTVRLAIPRARGDVFGVACPGGLGLPQMSVPGLPIHGQTASVALANVPAGLPVIVGISPNLAISVIGGGCVTYVGPPVLTFNVMSSGTGDVLFPFDIPPAPMFTGAELFFQFAVMDPAGAFGTLSFSAAARIRVGF